MGADDVELDVDAEFAAKLLLSLAGLDVGTVSAAPAPVPVSPCFASFMSTL